MPRDHAAQRLMSTDIEIQRPLLPAGCRSSMLTDGEMAPPFSLPDINGPESERHYFGESAVDQVVLLVFVRNGSNGLDDFRPLFDLAWFEFMDGVRVILVATGEGANNLLARFTRIVESPLLSDADGRVASAYGLENRDEAAVFVIDESGAVRARRTLPSESLDLSGIREVTNHIHGRGSAHDEQRSSGWDT